MSARTELHRYLLASHGSHMAHKLMDDYAHELAEQIRRHEPNAPESSEWLRGRDDASDLIDPDYDHYSSFGVPCKCGGSVVHG